MEEALVTIEKVVWNCGISKYLVGAMSFEIITRWIILRLRDIDVVKNKEKAMK